MWKLLSIRATNVWRKRKQPLRKIPSTLTLMSPSHLRFPLSRFRYLLGIQEFILDFYFSWCQTFTFFVTSFSAKWPTITSINRNVLNLYCNRNKVKSSFLTTTLLDLHTQNFILLWNVGNLAEGALPCMPSIWALGVYLLFIMMFHLFHCFCLIRSIC